MEIARILEEARSKRCSDIHISVGQGIAFRLNGRLQYQDLNYSNDELEMLIMTSANSRANELLAEGKDADFVFIDETHGHSRYRVNVYFAQGRMNAAYRVINEEILTVEELGLPSILNKLAMDHRGLVLVTGPTGSGKSTTLAAVIDYINQNRNCHILTIEDPVEYLYHEKQALIHQREIHGDVDSFDTALRSAMREDPDVILVGEMRDYETISAVITLAETGHLVFSTLHTSGAAKTIDRIVDVFPSHRQAQVRTQLAGILNAVITQTLLPTADSNGRVAALEIMIATDAIRTMIREAKVHQITNIMATGANFGMITLDNALANLVKQGKVTRMVAQERCMNINDFNSFFGQ